MTCNLQQLHSQQVADIKKAIDIAYAEGREDEREEIVTLIKNTEEYISVKDESSHRYQIPRSKKEEWDTFCEIPEDDEASWNVPDWAEQIDGMPVTSLKESLLRLLDGFAHPKECKENDHE
ncbi:TPA: hypothetical protein DEP58_01770 [Patescibacteria group bacterium]|nr:hypothetical protein [Patescibacteria group bacterium]